MLEVTDKNSRLRPMEEEDLDDVLKIERRSFPFPWTRQMWKDELLVNERVKCYVIEIEGRVVACYSSWHIAMESFLNNIAVDPEYRKWGLGRMMLDHFLKEARDHDSEACYLEVAEGNTDAIDLYERNGFKHIDTRRDYYSMEHKDAYIMKKEMGADNDTLGNRVFM